jgi:hypothetical protein
MIRDACLAMEDIGRDNGVSPGLTTRETAPSFTVPFTLGPLSTWGPATT